MRKIFLTGAALGLFGFMTAPASAMPVAKIAPAIIADETAAVHVHYRRYCSRYSYRPRARYVYRTAAARASGSASAPAAGNS